jgi:hypothetical protein
MNAEYLLLSMFNKPMLTLAEVCSIVGVEVTTAHVMRSKGTFPIPSAESREPASWLMCATWQFTWTKQGKLRLDYGFITDYGNALIGKTCLISSNPSWGRYR